MSPLWNGRLALDEVFLTFPVCFHLFGREIHPHPVMEGAAYLTGFVTHLAIKQRVRTTRGEAAAAELERSLWTIAGAILGALVGAKVLAWAENWHQLMQVAGPPGLERWIGGKTIVGGLIGGWIGVELAKKLTGVTQRTGDTWVYPLCVSIAIGRVGCFLTGLADQTHGNFTTLPWGVDFGDGVRHPTQLYEVLFLLVLGAGLAVYQWRSRMGFGTGRVFRMFMGAYCGWRFLIEFIKPSEKPWVGLSAIQVVSLVVCLYCLWSLRGMIFGRSGDGGSALSVL